MAQPWITKKIRGLPGGKDVKIIAVTAHAFEEHREEILATGCDELVRKSFRESTIFKVMGKQLGIRYLYEETPADLSLSASAHEKEIDPATYEDLPDELILAFEQAVIDLDVELMTKFIDQIREMSPVAAAELDGMANSFQYDRILQIVKKRKKDRNLEA